MARTESARGLSREMTQSLSTSTQQLSARVETVERDLASVRVDLGHLRTELSSGLSEIRDLISRNEQGKEKTANAALKVLSIFISAVVAVLAGLVWLVNSQISPVALETVHLSDDIGVIQRAQVEVSNKLVTFETQVESLNRFVDRWYNDFKIPERLTRLEMLSPSKSPGPPSPSCPRKP
jgi:hypothetical protein